MEEMSADDLMERCRKKMVIHVDDVKKACTVLSRVIDQNEMVITEGCVTLFSHLQESANINRILCDNDVQVSQLEIRTETLEQYFMGKVEG